MILAHLATIIGILVSVAPLVVSVAKLAPRLFAFLAAIFGAGKGFAGKSGLAGILLAVFTFVGGVGFVVFMYYNFSLKLYMGWLDFVLTPFSFILKQLLTLVVNQLPSNPMTGAMMTRAFAPILSIFSIDKIAALFLTWFATEFYLRMFIYFFARRGK